MICNNVLQGAFIGGLSSLIFTMWIGFGQTAAKFNKGFTIPTLPTTTESCPEVWFNTTQPTEFTNSTESSSFNHLPIYEVSYMWFSAIPCLWTVFVGSLLSFATGPQDPKKLNPVLISPALKNIWGIWPRKVKEYFKTGIRIGEEYVSN